MKIVRGVSITPESVDISYMDEAVDLRADGLVYQVHTISCSRLDPELEEQMEAMETAVTNLLEAGVRRWSTTVPISPQELNERLQFDLDEEDDDDGMR